MKHIALIMLPVEGGLEFELCRCSTAEHAAEIVRCLLSAMDPPKCILVRTVAVQHTHGQ